MEKLIPLNECYMTKLSLCEAKGEKKPGVLCTLEGPFMEIENENRNTRIYSLSLCENKIIGDPWTKE